MADKQKRDLNEAATEYARDIEHHKPGDEQGEHPIASNAPNISDGEDGKAVGEAQHELSEKLEDHAEHLDDEKDNPEGTVKSSNAPNITD